MERIYYVGTGEQSKMYTLRAQFESTLPVQTATGTQAVPVIRDYYLQNLSTDANKAVERAKELGFHVEKPKFTLEDIQRNQAKLAEEQRKQIEREAEAERIAHIDRMMLPIENGCFPFGRHKHESFDSVFKKDRGYIKYWVRTNVGEDIVASNLQKVLRAAFPDLIEDEIGNGQYFGEIKKRYRDMTAKVVGKFGFETFYGYTFVTKFVLETGEMVVYMGSKYLEVDEDDSVTMDFTVKSHEEYRGEFQTKILRVKVHSDE